MAKISVIIPVYNMERYLAECLDSVQRQTIFGELELVCVNDGSKDRSLQILQDYAGRYPNILVIDQENAGVAAARNAGMRAASGEFIAFLDPDDFYVKDNCLERMYGAAKAYGARICGGSYSRFTGDRIRFRFDGIYRKNTFEKEGMIRYADYQYDYGFYRYIYERRMILENDLFFPPYIRYQDPPFFVRAMICAGEFCAIPDITYCYRAGHQNIDWSEKRVSHLLQGLTDILRDSSAAGLQELHRLTMFRLRKDCGAFIMKNLGSPQVLRLLAEADAAVRRDWTEGEGADPDLKGGAVALIEELKDRTAALEQTRVRAQADLEAAETKRAAANEALEKAERERNEARAERERLERETAELRKTLQWEKKKNEDLKASVSYRFGRAVTGPARKLRDVLRGNGKKG